jgi:hypothetical protein
MKIKFISQARVQSPTFAVFASNVDLCTESYRRYVENCIPERFPFTGTPIRHPDCYRSSHHNSRSHWAKVTMEVQIFVLFTGLFHVSLEVMMLISRFVGHEPS